jgi:hypothetical protein
MALAIAAAVSELLFDAGASLAVVNFALVAVPIAVNLAVSIGLSLLTAALTKSPLPGPSDQQQEIRQALGPRVKSYGRVRVSGTVWWFAAINDVLTVGIAINQGRVSNFVSFHIDENQVDIDGTDQVTTSPYDGYTTLLHHRFGLTPETKYSEMLTDYGVDEMRGDGVCTLLAQLQNPGSAAHFQTLYPNGVPNLRVTIEASLVWDPRDPAQVRADPTTWGWSENPIVCLLDFLVSADGFGIRTYDLIARNLDQWIAAMNTCEELVPLVGGGFGQRYAIAGTYRLTDAPKDVLDRFMSVCDGRVWVKRDGSIGIAVGVFKEPTVVIDQAHVTGWSSLLRGQDPVTSIDGIRAQFMSPDDDYREHEAEPWPTGADVAEFDDQRVASLDLLWVPSNSQARRLMKRQFIRSRSEWAGTIFTDAYGLRALDERYVRFQIPELGLDQSFEITSFDFDPGALTCSLTVVAVDASIDAWDPSEEGPLEASLLAFAGHFEKVGTTLDVLGEAGGQIGHYAVVGCANQTGFPATPAGWELVGTDNTPFLFIAVFGRKLDGSETVTTFQSASGVILVNLFRGVTDAAFSSVYAHAGTDAVNAPNWPSTGVPFVVFTFQAFNQDLDIPDWAHLTAYVSGSSGSQVDIADHSFRIQSGSGLATGYAMFAIYRSGETPPDFFNAYNSDDRGKNGLISFNLASS